MPIEETSYEGWQKNLRLSNESVELIISLEVGPRILSYRPLNGSNILKNYSEQMGKTGEPKWKIRGGHRLWIAPEDPVLTYALDNEPVPHELLGDLSARLTTVGDPDRRIRKELTVALAPSGSGVQLTHTLTNDTDEPQTLAPWALTVMAPGGIALVPQPPLGEHPRDLLPNRALILWAFSDTSDSRFHLGKNFIALKQEDARPPFKFGLALQGGWAGYLLGDQFFTKTVSFIEGATYADMGCNYESFTNDEMLEVETLGPLVTLAPGESITHLETWNLHSGLQVPPYADTAEFADWLQPYLPQ
ncbi:MAG TPA: hypothetical protein VF585_03890 [Chthoniobacterales bacterium]|jgi:hypothetical protein